MAQTPGQLNKPNMIPHHFLIKVLFLEFYSYPTQVKHFNMNYCKLESGEG